MTQKIILEKYLDALSHVIFPNTCAHCQTEIGRFEYYMCHACWEAISHTHYEHYEDITTLDRLFFGRIHLQSTYSLFHFEEGNPIQSLLHTLKYHHQEKVGRYLGRILGEKLRIKSFPSPIDLVVPVPIHPKKEFHRGYNQCDSICRGLAETMKLPIDRKILKKIKYNSSQTKKSKWERLENSKANFSVYKTLTPYQHILIVDDVITTGATIESLGKLLVQEYPSLKISVASIAFSGK